MYIHERNNFRKNKRYKFFIKHGSVGELYLNDTDQPLAAVLWCKYSGYIARPLHNTVIICTVVDMAIDNYEFVVEIIDYEFQ